MSEQTAATLEGQTRVLTLNKGKKNESTLNYDQPDWTVESLSAQFADGEVGLIRQASKRIITDWKAAIHFAGKLVPLETILVAAPVAGSGGGRMRTKSRSDLTADQIAEFESLSPEMQAILNFKLTD